MRNEKVLAGVKGITREMLLQIRSKLRKISTLHVERPRSVRLGQFQFDMDDSVQDIDNRLKVLNGFSVEP
jgi:hypothetical protein